MAKGIHKPPSRVRYEQANPTISFRVSREIYNELKQHLVGRRVSFADFVKESLGVQIADVAKVKQNALKEGYAKAEKDFRIWYYCANCGKAIVIKPDSESHKAVIKAMKEYRWVHTQCP